ncbi:uncharacterized protein PHALS_00783 [Plasmopara halstedii]|uniref:Uncharacterized protein n=1 Tax=Plasmopara halstedii TaxID=4781 RepID=A0A0P1ATZ2_PLAHL|nr:uncharacterized protein PHALS_00783 [Plasmopara halstedii]CEG44415.1 hypothetical protein PHALS_00783 [Plasmopara halstedii]|eukprot:XP_024580784.1 hypothetical protein PHALS_00783 [Plasmopara halstedii]
MANHSETSADHQHQLVGDCPHAVASIIIQRHHDKRQRFDSADYEMAQRVSGPCLGCTCGKCTLSDGTDLEHEPEPGLADKPEQLRCLRLQRFDSADWALQTQCTESLAQTDEMPTSVAQLLLNRHALKTCAYVGPVFLKSGEHSTGLGLKDR